ncbi:acyltransferase family protein [Sphingobacterium sp. SRCM116780]|uniref:acyltransferase n=1 Tax=Sphingobacterium sp. SRCM116780 TaxID=2907623 RepID=UPI001F2248CF|nr:acyltransferase family protein [Sphingobacterium sp. SRCM116780]UIR56168.1 acyltransferase family protein [Sphingobacterium sp. SRCM116780]
MTEKLSYIRVLRIIATIAVIAIHASSGYLNSINITGFDWNYANAINSFTRFSVPIFVMLSGALLLTKEEQVGLFYKKRLSKICYPFIFWTIIYILYHMRGLDLTTDQLISTVIYRLKNGANAHLWYLYMIIGLYLAIPFLQKIMQHATIREIEIFLFLWFVTLFTFNKGLPSYFPKLDLTFFSGYIGFLILGYYLRVKDFSSYKVLSLFIFILTAVATTYFTYKESLNEGKFTPFLYGYLSPNTFIIATSLFIFIKSIAEDITLPKWALWIDDYSFGVYLCHILILNYVHPLLPVGTALKIPLAILITLFCSVLLTYILRKLPFGKYVSG